MNDNLPSQQLIVFESEKKAGNINAAAETQLQVIVELVRREHYEEAIDRIDHLLKKYPQNAAELLAFKGILLQKMGCKEDATLVFLQSLKLKPLFNTQLALVLLYLKADEKQKARDLALLLKPETEEQKTLYERLQKVLPLSDDEELRNKILDKINELFEEDKEEKTKEALTLALEAAQKFPSDTLVLVYVAVIYEKLKKYDEAILYYQKVLNKEENFSARYGMATSFISKEEYEAALNVAILLQPKNKDQEKQVTELMKLIYQSKANWIVKLVNRLQDKRSYECAERILRNFLALDPLNHTLRIALARLYGNMTFYDLGLWHAYSVLRQDPTNKDAWLAVGDLYNWRGSYLLSVQIYRYLLSLGKNDAALLNLGWDYYYLRNLGDACRIAYQLKNRTLYCAIHNDTFLDFPYPTLTLTYRSLHDSQELDWQKVSALYTWQQGNCLWDIYCAHVDAQDPDFGGFLDHASVNLACPLNLSWSYLANLGIAHVNSHIYATGKFGTALKGYCNLFQTYVSHDIYESSAQAMDNRIRYWTVDVQYTQFLGDWAYTGAQYLYTKFSDSNHINYLDLYYDFLMRRRIPSTKYRCLLNPRINLRYDIVLQNAAENAILGYFSPKRYLENRLTFTWLIMNFNSNPLLEIIPNVAYVTYHSLGQHLNTLYYGGIANAYIDITPRMLIVAGFKFGKYPFGGLNDYDYTELAIRLMYGF